MNVTTYKELMAKLSQTPLEAIVMKFIVASGIVISKEEIAQLAKPFGTPKKPAVLVQLQLHAFSLLDKHNNAYTVWFKAHAVHHDFTIDVSIKEKLSELSPVTIIKKALLTLTLLITHPELCNAKQSDSYSLTTSLHV